MESRWLKWASQQSMIPFGLLSQPHFTVLKNHSWYNKILCTHPKNVSEETNFFLLYSRIRYWVFHSECFIANVFNIFVYFTFLSLKYNKLCSVSVKFDISLCTLFTPLLSARVPIYLWDNLLQNYLYIQQVFRFAGYLHWKNWNSFLINFWNC